MNFGFFEFLQLAGALGFFIYGMKLMSESIQKVAGSKMRTILSAMTSNRFKGVFTGFALTSLVQSSSATTVLVVSFVNAGLLSLIEAIGVIMGANIGTTVTAWIISIIGFKVNIEIFALPIIAIGFPLLFSGRNKLKAWGEVLIGFAILFLGLEFLKAHFSDLGSNPEVLKFLSNYTDAGFWSILLFVGIGTVITVIVQSSSAAIAITLIMANNGWITFDLAAAMVLGENLGTTITANLAALVANVHAKRAAVSHFIFNFFGVVWILALMPFFLKGIDAIMIKYNGMSPYATPEAMPVALSIFHTAFNVTNVLLLIGFVNLIAKTVTKIIPSKGDDEHYHLEFIGGTMMGTAELALGEAAKEIAKFGDITARMNSFLEELIFGEKNGNKEKLIARIKKYEEITDRIETEVTAYLIKVSKEQLSAESKERIAGFLSICNDLERIGDIIYQMSREYSRMLEDSFEFNDKQLKGIKRMLKATDEAFQVMVENLNENPDKVTMVRAFEKEHKINMIKKKLYKKHLKQMNEDDYDVRSGSVYKDFFFSGEKVGDHIINVTEAITGEKERDFVSFDELDLAHK